MVIVVIKEPLLETYNNILSFLSLSCKRSPPTSPYFIPFRDFNAR